MGPLSVGCADPVSAVVAVIESAWVLGVTIDSCAPPERARRARHPAVRLDGQVLPLIDTRVTFPAGGLTADAEVLAVVRMDDLGDGGLLGFVTDVTPFHPVDHGWPDQGPDRGAVSIGGIDVEMVDVVLGATQGMNLLTASKIPVRRGEPGWAFVVVHVISADQVVPSVGQRVALAVDAAHREALSFGHSACHIASLALNASLAGRWGKPVAPDGLGHPNFDHQALSVSRIHPDGAIDVYRLGKSLRKKGFDTGELPLAEIAATANAHLARWVAAGATIAIEADGPGLTDRRTWVCDLPDGQERIDCGGTHLSSLIGVEAIRIELGLKDAELIMETKVTRRK